MPVSYTHLDIFHATGFSRAKISVYLKNLANFNIAEKVVSFETGGWENAKKGVYQIKEMCIRDSPEDALTAWLRELHS